MTAAGGYLAPRAAVRAELREKGSRFLAIVLPAADEREARVQLSDLRQRYAEATHVCWARRLGAPPREARSDAGEPRGTAGEPMLRVLQGAELSDVLAVVVRWYGGTKLGKGGLARAYAGVLQQALERLAVTRRQAAVRLRLSLPYGVLGEVRRLVRPPEVEIAEERFGERAVVVLRVFESRLDRLEDRLASLGIDAERQD